MSNKRSFGQILKAILVIFAIGLLVGLAIAAIVGALTGNVFGFLEWDVVLGFFEGVTAEQAIFALLTVVFWLVPEFGKKLYNYLKTKWGLADDQAHDFLFAISFILSAIAMLVTGALQLDGLEFNAINVVTLGAANWGLSQLVYKRLYPDG